MSHALALQMRAIRVVRGAVTVLDNVHLQVAPGEFVCLLGPSGCGKTTLLDLAAGLGRPSAGQVICMGRPVEGLNLLIGYLFQQDALLPWCTTLDNVCLPLRLRGIAPGKARREGRQWLERVGLGRFADYHPAQLSGGMRKRAALAQVLAHDAPVLLMDEPFAALDAQLRQAMQELLMNLWEQQRKAVLFVTHDLDEALTLADRIVMLSAGPDARTQYDLTIDLPRPRRMLTLRSDPEYQHVYRQLWQKLHAQPATTERGARS